MTNKVSYPYLSIVYRGELGVKIHLDLIQGKFKTIDKDTAYDLLVEQLKKKDIIVSSLDANEVEFCIRVDKKTHVRPEHCTKFLKERRR